MLVLTFKIIFATISSIVCMYVLYVCMVKLNVLENNVERMLKLLLMNFSDCSPRINDAIDSKAFGYFYSYYPIGLYKVLQRSYSVLVQPTMTNKYGSWWHG